MYDLNNYWKLHHYIEPVMCIVLIITLATALTHRKKFATLKFIPLYTIGLLLICVTAAVYQINGIHRYLYFAHYLDYTFTLLEMVIFSHFFYQLLTNRIIKKLIVPLNISFFVFSIIMMLRDKDFSFTISEQTQRVVYTVEGILLLVLCILCLFELSRKPKNLAHDPRFWVASGIFIFLACTLPFSIIENYISERHSTLLYPIFYVFYIFFFLMIIRAYLCPAPPDERINGQKVNV
jgi:hypothetical protein